MISGQILKDGSVSRSYNGTFDCAKSLINEHGFKILYKGMVNIYFIK
jgi:hypothetical protein